MQRTKSRKKVFAVFMDVSNLSPSMQVRLGRLRLKRKKEWIQTFVSMNTSAFMHLFARRSYTDAKVLSRLKKFGHVSSGSAIAIIVAIDGFEVFGHMLNHLSFEILNSARRASIKLVINFD